MARTLTELAEQLAVAPWTGDNGSRFFGVLCGVLNDMLAEGAAEAFGAQLVYPFVGKAETYEQPPDALEALGIGCGRPHYPGEPYYLSLRARIRGKWDFWTGGIKAGLIAELAAAGYTATVVVPNDFVTPPDPASYWSRFWVRFPLGTHPVTGGAGFVLGTSVVGTDRIGPAGLQSATGAAYLTLLKSIVRRYKPAIWVCWNLEFEYASGKYIRLQVHKRYADANYIYEDT